MSYTSIFVVCNGKHVAYSIARHCCSKNKIITIVIIIVIITRYDGLMVRRLLSLTGICICSISKTLTCFTFIRSGVEMGRVFVSLSWSRLASLIVLLPYLLIDADGKPCDNNNATSTASFVHGRCIITIVL